MTWNGIELLNVARTWLKPQAMHLFTRRLANDDCATRRWLVERKRHRNAPLPRHGKIFPVGLVAIDTRDMVQNEVVNLDFDGTKTVFVVARIRLGAQRLTRRTYHQCKRTQ